MKAPTMRALLVGLALALAACGGGVGDDAAAVGADPNGGDDGACKIEVPDCDDDAATDSDGLGGGLTVEQALATSADVFVLVRGYVVIDATGARLCDALAESYPPQCGGASLIFDNPEAIPDTDDLSTEQGVTWSDEWVTFVGEVTDGVLTIDPESS